MYRQVAIEESVDGIPRGQCCVSEFLEDDGSQEVPILCRRASS
jgi:hypothetical protein